MSEVEDQASVGLVETPMAPFEGEGPEGVPGVGQADAPDWVTVNVFWAIVIVPVRSLVLELASTE